MERLLFLLFLAGISRPAFAQLNIAALQDGHNAANAARHLPVYLGDRFQKFEVSVFNPYISIGSNFASARDAREYLTADRITSELIGHTVNKLKPDENNIAAVLDLSILNVAFNTFNRNGQKALSIGFGVDERVEVNAVFNPETFLLAYNGNKQFAGQTISVAPRFNALAYTGYYLSAAYNIHPAGSDVVIKPAVRIGYLSGQAGVQMSKNSAITLYTEPDGRYLDFGFGYDINTSVGNDSVKLSGSSFNVNDKNLQPGAGSGFGMDLGLRISPRPGLLLNIGLMDIGAIRFTQHTVNIYNHSQYRYEGQQISFTENQGISLDSLAGIADPQYAYDPYSVSLPTKLVLAGSIGFGRSADERSGPWYKHQVCLTYVQGFANYLSATTAPYVAAGYTYSFDNVLNVGANVGAGGLWGGSLGLLASVKAGPFVFGLSSNNVLPLLFGGNGRGSDAAAMLGLLF